MRIIAQNEMNTFLHSGHIGDIIASLPAVRAAGGGHLVITDNDDNVHLKMEGRKYEAIRPLLVAQKYLHAVSFRNHTGGVTHDFRGFRRYWGTGTIPEYHAKAIGVDISYEKWLDVEPLQSMRGRVVISRSPRYRNYNFPWKAILKRIGDRAIFIGVDDEPKAFMQETGITLEQHKCYDCLDVARAIAGSDLFIGNQSSPFWMAAGLNHPCIQETCLDIPDSIVPYNTARYVRDGAINYDELGI